MLWLILRAWTDWTDHLKQNKMDKEKEKARLIEPEKIVAGMNNWNALDDVAALHDSNGHLCDDHLELRSN